MSYYTDLDRDRGDTEQANSDCFERERHKIAQLHTNNKKARVGSIIICPICLKKFSKRSYQHVFCRNKGVNNCKDRFWNTMDDTRLERAKTFA